jgi:hypothetical protein
MTFWNPADVTALQGRRRHWQILPHFRLLSYKSWEDQTKSGAFTRCRWCNSLVRVDTVWNMEGTPYTVFASLIGYMDGLSQITWIRGTYRCTDPSSKNSKHHPRSATIGYLVLVFPFLV